jgi:hypothetical protein
VGNIDTKLICEAVQEIQGGMTDLHNSMIEWRADMRDLKESQLSTREEIQALRRDVLQCRVSPSKCVNHDRMSSDPRRQSSAASRGVSPTAPMHSHERQKP